MGRQDGGLVLTVMEHFIQSHITFTTIFEGRNYTHFTDLETEVQLALMRCQACPGGTMECPGVLLLTDAPTWWDRSSCGCVDTGLRTQTLRTCPVQSQAGQRQLGAGCGAGRGWGMEADQYYCSFAACLGKMKISNNPSLHVSKNEWHSLLIFPFNSWLKFQAVIKMGRGGFVS